MVCFAILYDRELIIDVEIDVESLLIDKNFSRFARL